MRCIYEHVGDSESVIDNIVPQISVEGRGCTVTMRHPALAPPIVAKVATEISPLSSHLVKPKIYPTTWWKKIISVSALGVATAICVLFELLEYHLLTLVCHILI
ncbi:hypothetical protein Dimus_028000 [Dionaea muscipula]